MKMDVSTKKPEDVIRPESLEAYKTAHGNIFGRLVHINTSIRIIETISSYQYPLRHIYMHGTFWTMVYWNFLYTVIVLLHGIVNDDLSNTLSLKRFKNLIRKDWLKRDDCIQASFSKQLREAKFSSGINSICNRIERMRHNVVAHRNYSVEEGLPDFPGVSFPDIKKVSQSAGELFSACSFGVECFTNLYWPSIQEPEPNAKDVMEILDLLVKNSHWLNQPERRGPHWESIREFKNKKDLAELNVWREKYGFKPA